MLFIDALLDLCDAYDDGPSHISRRLLRVHSFVRSIHKAEAGDAPLGTRLILNHGRMVKIVPASPCHPLVWTYDGYA